MSGQSISGLHTWLIQRISAIYIVLFLFYATVSLLILAQIDYTAWREWVNQTVTKSLLGVFMLAILMHAWIGLRDVLLDYIKPFSLRIVALTIGAFFLLAMAVWMFAILFSVGVT